MKPDVVLDVLYEKAAAGVVVVEVEDVAVARKHLSADHLAQFCRCKVNF